MQSSEVEVPYGYEPTADCTWVEEDEIPFAMSRGYAFHRLRGNICFRRTPSGQRQYLLRKPGPA